MGVQINGSDGRIISTHADHSGNVSIGGTLTYEDVTNIDSVGLVTARSGIEIGARPGVAASISVDGNMIVSGITTFTPGGSEIVRINSSGLLAYNDVSFFGDSTHAYWDKSANQFLLSDNTKLSVGSGSDLQIYHDGSNSRIKDTGTGSLKLSGNVVAIENSGTTETMATFTENGGVQLYYDNSLKVDVKTWGVEINGDLGLDDNYKVALGNGPDLLVWHDGSSSLIQSASHPLAYYSNTRHHFLNGDGSENMAVFTTNGSCSLYQDNDKVLETIEYGIQAGDNTRVYENSSHNIGIVRHADMHHAIIFRATSNADGSSLTNTNATTFREYGNFEFMTGAINMSTKLTISQNGSIGAPSGTNIYNASDLRLKKNVVTLDKGLESIKSIRPVSFNWIDGFCDVEKDTLYGFVAQEVQTVDPNLVCPFGTEGANIKIGEDQENPDQVIEDPLRVNEKFVVPMLVKSVQELSAEVDALKSEIAALKSN